MIPILEKPILEEFKRRVEQRFPGEIVRLVLFGSKARGDASVESDFDVLVVIRSEDFLRPTISLDTPLGHTAPSLNGGVYGESQDGARPVFLAEEDGGRVARVTRRGSGSRLT